MKACILMATWSFILVLLHRFSRYIVIFSSEEKLVLSVPIIFNLKVVKNLALKRSQADG